MVTIRCLYLPFVKVKDYLTPYYKKSQNGVKGIVTSISFCGHANYLSNGLDMACGSISTVAIGYSKAIATNKKLRSHITAKKAGELKVELLTIDINQLAWLIGLQSGLFLSLEAVKKEYPKSCKIVWSAHDFSGFYLDNGKVNL